MHTLRRLRALVTLVLASAAGIPSAAAQDGVTSQVHAGGGYDSNPSFAADPSNRRQPTESGRGHPSPTPTSMGEGLGRVWGFVAGQLGSSPRGSVRFDLDGRVYGDGQLLFWERLAIQGALKIDDVSPRCRAEGSRLDLTASADSSFSVMADCGVLARLPEGFWTEVGLEGGVRMFDQGQLDGIAGGELSAGWTSELLSIDVGFTVLRRESTNQVARRTDLSPWIAVRVTTPWIGGQIGYRFVGRVFDSDSRSGGEHTGQAEIWGMFVPWLGIYADLQLGYAEGGPQALSYERVQVTGGLRLVLEWQPEPAELPPPSATQGPATVLDDGAVRFVFELPDASEVSVVGDFDGWDEARGRLTRRADGRFEGRFEVGPGRHEYALIVDGQPLRPPGAERYVSDGFGGENAVLIVPGAP